MSGPVLIFPEGYCTNNQKVLQFRRAVFEMDVVIHPIAIRYLLLLYLIYFYVFYFFNVYKLFRQHAQFGDSYWSENLFVFYLRRILSSWAIVYDIIYLPPQKRHFDEDATQFAGRVQVTYNKKILLLFVIFRILLQRQWALNALILMVVCFIK